MKKSVSGIRQGEKKKVCTMLAARISESKQAVIKYG